MNTDVLIQVQCPLSYKDRVVEDLKNRGITVLGESEMEENSKGLAFLSCVITLPNESIKG